MLTQKRQLMNITYKIPESKSDITVKQYIQIANLYKQAEENEVEVNEHHLISICLGVSVDVVSKLPITEYNLASENIAKALKEEVVMPLTFNLNGITYGFIPDIEDITIGEYSTLDTLMKDANKNACEILNVLYRPIVKEKVYKSLFSKRENKRYTIKPYNPNKDVSVFEYLPCSVFESSLLFFYSLGNDLLNATLKYTREELEKKEVEDSGRNGDGIRRLIHTLQQQELTLMTSTKKLQIRYSLD